MELKNRIFARSNPTRSPLEVGGRRMSVHKIASYENFYFENHFGRFLVGMAGA